MIFLKQSLIRYKQEGVDRRCMCVCVCVWEEGEKREKKRRGREVSFCPIGFSSKAPKQVLDWLARMLKLPEEFLSSSGNGGGVLQGTASEALLVALVAAKRKGTVGLYYKRKI